MTDTYLVRVRRGGISFVTREYAKYKNRHCVLAFRVRFVVGDGFFFFQAMTIGLADRRYDMADEPSVLPRTGPANVRKRLPPAARRALAEAEARRASMPTATSAGPKEVQGPKGPEPTRFGDWERNGIASDF